MTMSDNSRRWACIRSRIRTQPFMLSLLHAQVELPLALALAIPVFIAVSDFRVGKIMKSKRIASIVAIACLSGCSTLPTAHRTTTQEANHTYVLSGQGSPTVILESGLGDGKESWAPVYDQISQLTQVFAYDRAGYGASRSANQMRDGATIVHELRSTLQALKLQPPFILVIHQLGHLLLQKHEKFGTIGVKTSVSAVGRRARTSRILTLVSGAP